VTVTHVYSGFLEVDGRAVPAGTAVEVRAAGTVCGVGETALTASRSTYEVEVLATCGEGVVRELFVDDAYVGTLRASGGQQDFAYSVATPAADITSTPSRTIVPVAQWVGSVCESLGSWIDSIRSLSEEVGDRNPPDEEPEEGRALVIMISDRLVSLTGDLVSSTAAAGVPQVTDGEPIATAVVEGFEAVHLLFVDIRDRAAAVPVHDAAAFRAAVDDLVAELDEATAGLTETFAAIDEEHDTSELSRAFQDEETCAGLFGGGGPF
jgi:hypothetical protein